MTDIPSDRCGYEWPADTDADLPSFVARPHWCCWRKTWDDFDQCIWHTETDAEKPVGELECRREAPEYRERARSSGRLAEFLDGAHLSEVDLTEVSSFEGCRLQGADLSGANLLETDLPDADLWRADLSDADFRRADLSGARFTNSTARWTNLFNVTASNADFTGCNLLGADFEKAVLRNAMFDGARLVGSRLYDTKLNGVSINDQTAFSERTVYEKEADPCEPSYSAASDPIIPTDRPDPSRPGAFTFDLKAGEVPDSFVLAVRAGHILKRREQEVEQSFIRRSAAAGRRAVRRFTAHRAIEEPGKTVEQLDRAISVYRSRQRLHRENSQPEDVESPYIREKSCRRKRAFIRGRRRKWLAYASSRWVMLYGESPARVVGTSIAVIGVFAVLYAVFGGVHLTPEPATYVMFDPGATLGIKSETFEEASSYLYFSTITFSTLGYGGIQPATTATQLLASVQSLLGQILIALLVAVFARRALR